MTSAEFWEQVYLRCITTCGSTLAKTKADESVNHWRGMQQRERTGQGNPPPVLQVDPNEDLNIPF